MFSKELEQSISSLFDQAWSNKLDIDCSNSLLNINLSWVQFQLVVDAH